MTFLKCFKSNFALILSQFRPTIDFGFSAECLFGMIVLQELNKEKWQEGSAFLSLHKLRVDIVMIREGTIEPLSVMVLLLVFLLDCSILIKLVLIRLVIGLYLMYK